MPAIYGGGNPNGESRVLVSEIGSEYLGNNLYYNICNAPDGKLYSAPTYTDAKRVLMIDPETNKTELLGAVYEGNTKWGDFILGKNGKLYATPYGANLQAMEFDPILQSTSLFGVTTPSTSNFHYLKGIIADNGKIYSPIYIGPTTGAKTLMINPETKTSSFIGDNCVYNSRYNRILSRQIGNNIYVASAYPGQYKILEINTAADTATTIGNTHPDTNAISRILFKKNGSDNILVVLVSIDNIFKFTEFNLSIKQYGASVIASMDSRIAYTQAIDLDDFIIVYGFKAINGVNSLIVSKIDKSNYSWTIEAITPDMTSVAGQTNGTPIVYKNKDIFISINSNKKITKLEIFPRLSNCVDTRK